MGQELSISNPHDRAIVEDDDESTGTRSSFSSDISLRDSFDEIMETQISGEDQRKLCYDVIVYQIIPFIEINRERRFTLSDFYGYFSTDSSRTVYPTFWSVRMPFPILSRSLAKIPSIVAANIRTLILQEESAFLTQNFQNSEEKFRLLLRSFKSLKHIVFESNPDNERMALGVESWDCLPWSIHSIHTSYCGIEEWMESTKKGENLTVLRAILRNGFKSSLSKFPKLRKVHFEVDISTFESERFLISESSFRGVSELRVLHLGFLKRLYGVKKWIHFPPGALSGFAALRSLRVISFDSFVMELFFANFLEFVSSSQVETVRLTNGEIHTCDDSKFVWGANSKLINLRLSNVRIFKMVPIYQDYFADFDKCSLVRSFQPAFFTSLGANERVQRVVIDCCDLWDVGKEHYDELRKRLNMLKLKRNRMEKPNEDEKKVFPAYTPQYVPTTEIKKLSDFQKTAVVIKDFNPGWGTEEELPVQRGELVKFVRLQNAWGVVKNGVGREGFVPLLNIVLNVLQETKVVKQCELVGQNKEIVKIEDGETVFVISFKWYEEEGCKIVTRNGVVGCLKKECILRLW